MPVVLTGGNFRDPLGNTVNGILSLELSQDAKLITGGQIAPVTQSFALNLGNITGNPQIYGVDELNPGGLFYWARVLDSNNNPIYGPEKWQPSGGGTLDVGTLAPALATASAVPLLFSTGQTQMSFSATPQFNASGVNCFQITLTGNVTSSTVINAVTGQFLFFEIIQDVTGGRTFVWPVGFRGAMTVSPVSNAISSQLFYYDGVRYLGLGSNIN